MEFLGARNLQLRIGKEGQESMIKLSDSNVLPIPWIPLKKGFGSNLPRWLAAPATLSKGQAVKGNEVQGRREASPVPCTAPALLSKLGRIDSGSITVRTF